MKRVLMLILIITILFIGHDIPVYSYDIASYTLTEEDEKIMMTYKNLYDHYFTKSDMLKEKDLKYPSYVKTCLDGAIDYVKLIENYDFREISTEEGKERYLQGFDKYHQTRNESYLKQLKNKRLSFILDNQLVKRSVFVTNENYVLYDSITGRCHVRGILYFTILKKGDNADVYENIEEGIEYKAIAEVVPSSTNRAWDPSTFTIDRFDLISEPVVATSSIPAYSHLSDESNALGEKIIVDDLVWVRMPNLKKIVSYGDYYIALRKDGTVVAWGENYFEQCIVPKGLNSVKDIITCGHHTVALKEDGTIAAWGLNDYGQCNVPEGLTGVKAISAGYDFTVAVKENGTVVAWGNNSYGQCDVPEGLTGVKAVKSGTHHTIALKEDGTLVGWGQNTSGQLDIPDGLKGVRIFETNEMSTVALKVDGTLAIWGNNGYGQCFVPKGLPCVKEVRLGHYNVLALTEDGSVIAWGNNNYGQCNVPEGLAKVKSIASGGEYSMAVMEDGTVTAWGSWGQILGGLSSIKEINEKFAVEEDGTVIIWGNAECVRYKVMECSSKPISVTAGRYPGDFNAQLTGVLKDDGNVVVWASNDQVIQGFTKGLSKVKSIAAGVYYTLALKADGTVMGWGVNYKGTLDIPKGLFGVKAIAAGEHAAALKNNGTVVSWGELAPKIPKDLRNVKEIAAGTSHTVALKTDGTVVAWGDNSYNQCDVPRGLSHVKAIAAGNNFTVALKEDGTVAAWGDKYHDQCNVPKDLTNVKAITTGSNHTVALKEDGTVVSWGVSFIDLLKIPKWLSNVKVKAIGAGTNKTFVLLEDGTVSGWGALQKDNFYLPPFSPAYRAIPASSKVLVNSKEISFEAYEINDNYYFKLRDLAAALNGTKKQFEVTWDGTKSAINLITSKPYTTIGGELVVTENLTEKEARLAASKVYVNGIEVPLFAYTIGGNNYFKLKELAKVMDFNVQWDENSNTIRIDASSIYTE